MALSSLLGFHLLFTVFLSFRLKLKNEIMEVGSSAEKKRSKTLVTGERDIILLFIARFLKILDN